MHPSNHHPSASSYDVIQTRLNLIHIVLLLRAGFPFAGVPFFFSFAATAANSDEDEDEDEDEGTLDLETANALDLENYTSSPSPPSKTSQAFGSYQTL